MDEVTFDRRDPAKERDECSRIIHGNGITHDLLLGRART